MKRKARASSINRKELFYINLIGIPAIKKDMVNETKLTGEHGP